MYCMLLLLREGQRIFDEPIVARYEAMHYMHLRGSISSLLIPCVGNTIVEYCLKVTLYGCYNYVYVRKIMHYMKMKYHW